MRPTICHGTFFDRLRPTVSLVVIDDRSYSSQLDSLFHKICIRSSESPLSLQWQQHEKDKISDAMRWETTSFCKRTQRECSTPKTAVQDCHQYSIAFNHQIGISHYTLHITYHIVSCPCIQFWPSISFPRLSHPQYGLPAQQCIRTRRR